MEKINITNIDNYERVIENIHKAGKIQFVGTCIRKGCTPKCKCEPGDEITIYNLADNFKKYCETKK